MAHKKAGGSTRNGRDSQPKYLGLKKAGGEAVLAGNIIIRQRGTKYHAGWNVGVGKDYTLYALVAGNVKFEKRGELQRQYVSVIPADTQSEAAQHNAFIYTHSNWFLGQAASQRAKGVY